MPPFQRTLVAAWAVAAPAATCHADLLAEFVMNKAAVQILDDVDHPQVRVGALTRGPEITASNTAGQAVSNWAATGWTTANSRDSRDYFGFTLEARDSYIQLDRTSFNIERTEEFLPLLQDGPANWELRFSLDGFVAHDELIDSWSFGRNGGTRIEINDLILGAIRLLKPGDEVEFRLYGYQSGAAGGVGALEGTWEVLGNPVQPLALFQPEGSEDGLPDLAYRDGVTVGPMTRGPGLERAFGPGWLSRGWPQGGSWGVGDYLGTTIIASGGPVALDRASYTLFRSNSAADWGPAEWEFRYAINGGAESVLNSHVFADGQETMLTLNLDISGIPILQHGDELSLRWYGKESVPRHGGEAGGFSSNGPVLITGTSSRALARYIPARTAGPLVDRAGANSVIASDLRRGPGLTAYTESERDAGFLARGWANGTIDFEEDYFEATIQVVDGPVTFTGARYRLYRINDSTQFGGAASWRFRASVDGGPELDLKNTDFVWATGGPRSAVLDVSLGALPPLNNGSVLRFRWYGFTSGAFDQAGFAAGTEVTIYGDDGTGTSSTRPNGLRVWQAERFPDDFGNPNLRGTVWGRDADPDRDGKINLEEYLLLCDPHRFELFHLPVELGEKTLQFEVLLRNDPLAEVVGVFDTDLKFDDGARRPGTVQSSNSTLRSVLFSHPDDPPAVFGRLEVDYAD